MAEKYFLNVKDKHVSEPNIIFTSSNVKITSIGQRHLGGVIADIKYKDQ